MREKVIIALDVDSEQHALELTTKLQDLAGAFKVGLQLYNNTGPDIVRKLTGSGIKVFLDLKFHDIPNTAARAAEAVTGLGAFMFNLHAAGGKKMLSESAAAAGNKAEALGITRPMLIGVTVLTSMSETQLHNELGVARPLPEQVASLAMLCRDAGLDGVVASAREIESIRKVCGKNFIIVTPGVRPHWASQDDQTRVVTPAEAISLGADYVVVGRPVTAAPDPRGALLKIIAEME